MIPYWILFLIPALAVMTATGHRQHKQIVPIFLFVSLASLMIGMRFEVGGDWGAYLRIFSSIKDLSSVDLLISTDMGYSALNSLMNQWGWGIYGVNLVCGFIFMAGLAAFSLRMPNPWIAIMVAVPYLLTVVAMGYTRQATALGFEFFALTALTRRKYWKFYMYIICGALFHKTAIVLMLLGLFSGSNRFSLRRICLGLIVIYLSMNAFIADYYEVLFKNYVDAQMQSSGALIRVMMNVLPATLLLLLYPKWRKRVDVNSVWILFALASLACLGLLTVASTAVDRMALYLAPLQLYVWSNMSLVIKASWLRGAIVLYHAAVLLVWLNYATHSKYWLPYQSIIFVDIF
ncbi:MAG: EpsG family protein [Mariprofundus sp.]|nr:EpsG family protein [Mariprofundus sp.]